jgi:hypothetical protein
MPMKKYKSQQIVTVLRQIEVEREREDHATSLPGCPDLGANVLPLADVMLSRGIPENIRSDKGPVFLAKELRCG